jgi:hypothetical protein
MHYCSDVVLAATDENIKKYNLLKQGDFILFENDEDYITYFGIVLSVCSDEDWWGGGYYKILWAGKPQHEPISFMLVNRWREDSLAKIYYPK